MKVKLPLWFWIGLILNLSSWAISWLQVKPYSYYTFIGIWLGFILILDGLNFKIKGSSMLTRNRTGFFFTFLLSGIFWWIFEILVMVTKNWYYITDRTTISIFEHQLLGTIFFSTVIPAVLEVTELILNKKLFDDSVRIEKAPNLIVKIYPIFGILSLLLTIWLPQYFFPLMWIFLYFILDYANYKLGFDNLIKDMLRNNWKRILSIAFAALICGFFWEMWNSHADPKWIYQVPFVGVLKIFEMPVLGFIGYLPFGLEVFAFFSFFQGIFKYPKEKFFELNQTTFSHNKQPVRAVVVIILFLFVFMTGFGLVEANLYDKFQSKSMFFIEILPENINKNVVTDGIAGDIDSCMLGIIPSKCLVTSNKQVYQLINTLGEPINLENQKVVVFGKVLKSDSGFGLDQIQPRNIYKLD